METLVNKTLRLGLAASAVVWATACSDVSFTPGENAPEDIFLAPGQQKETFSFNDDGGAAKVDILFVVDNSASMADEQAKLSSALGTFISRISRVDWQIGITTTDVSEGPHGVKGSLVPFKGSSLRVLNARVPDHETLFRNSVVRDELIGCVNNCPSSDERPLEAVRLAMSKRQTSNAGFFRQGADLAVVILSDEDEGSNGSNALNPQVVIDTFKNTFEEGKNITGFGIIIRPGDTACYNQQSANAGNYGRVAALFAQMTGGLTGSICDSDYSPTLASIGDRVRETIKTVTLKKFPLPDSVQLRIRPFDPSLTWEIDGQVLRFNKTPKKGTRIDVLYYLPDQP